MKPRSRNTDPQTSRDAAKSVGKTEAKLAAVYDCLKRNGPMTHGGLCETYRREFFKYPAPMQSESSIRSRCAELRDAGLVEDSHLRCKTRYGRNSIVWRAVK